MNFCLASLAPHVLWEKSCKIKSCVLRDARLAPTVLMTQVQFFFIRLWWKNLVCVFKSFKSHQFNDLWLFAEKVLLLWLFMPRGISNRWTWQLLHNNYCFICNNAIDIWNNFIFLCFLQHSQPHRFARFLFSSFGNTCQ